MKHVAKTADARPAGFTGYGKSRTLPDFDLREALFVLSTALTATPEKDCNGTAADATIVGGPASDGLTVSATNKLRGPRFTRDVFTTHNAMTYCWIGKTPISAQELMGDQAAAGTQYASMHLPSGSILRALVRDTAVVSANADMTPPANMDTLFTLVFAIFTLTTVQIAYYRASTGLVLGPIATKASNPVGHAASYIQCGGYAATGSTVLLADTLQLALTVPQMTQYCAEAVKLMAAAGKVL